MRVRLSRKEVVRLTKIHPRTVQLYVEKGLVEPCLPAEGKGTWNIFSEVGVFQLLIARYLLKLGFTTGKMEPLIRKFTEETEDRAERLQVPFVEAIGSEYWILHDEADLGFKAMTVFHTDFIRYLINKTVNEEGIS